jgi:hypothetical protein
MSTTELTAFLESTLANQIRAEMPEDTKGTPTRTGHHDATKP